MSLRLFLAFPLDPKLRSRLQEVQDEVRGMDWELKFLARESLHLTLHFLGETPENLLQDLHHDLSALCHLQRPFELKVGGLGAFPNWEVPRVLWVGLKDSRQRLKDFHDATGKLLQRYRLFRLEANYVPHLSLARVQEIKASWDGKRLERLAEQWEDLGILNLEGLDLMESHLEAQGARYEYMERFRFHREIKKSSSN